MPTLKELRDAMVASHPDKEGGTSEAFIAAREAYNRKLKPHKNCFYCKKEFPQELMKYLGARVTGDPLSRKNISDHTVYSCIQCLDKKRKIRS